MSSLLPSEDRAKRRRESEQVASVQNNLQHLIEASSTCIQTYDALVAIDGLLSNCKSLLFLDELLRQPHYLNREAFIALGGVKIIIFIFYNFSSHENIALSCLLLLQTNLHGGVGGEMPLEFRLEIDRLKRLLLQLTSFSNNMKFCGIALSFLNSMIMRCQSAGIDSGDDNNVVSITLNAMRKYRGNNSLSGSALNLISTLTGGSTHYRNLFGEQGACDLVIDALTDLWGCQLGEIWGLRNLIHSASGVIHEENLRKCRSRNTHDVLKMISEFESNASEVKAEADSLLRKYFIA
jgi:hypothetical protein